MITPEKKQIVAMVTDDSVTDIKLIVGEAPAVSVLLKTVLKKFGTITTLTKDKDRTNYRKLD
jgi:hypothetical protein